MENKHTPFTRCPECGAALDPGEKCDCGKDAAGEKSDIRDGILECLDRLTDLILKNPEIPECKKIERRYCPVRQELLNLIAPGKGINEYFYPTSTEREAERLYEVRKPLFDLTAKYLEDVKDYMVSHPLTAAIEAEFEAIQAEMRAAHGE